MKNNLSEILELSAWLVEHGVSNDLWADSCIGAEANHPYNCLILSPRHVEGLHCIHPYITLERALEELPVSIDGFDLHYSKKNQHLAYVQITKTDRYTEYTYHKCQETWIGKQEFDYHLAALRLLKKVIESGHLKKIKEMEMRDAE